MEKSGVPTLQTAKIKGFIPVGRSDRASLYDESLPPGPDPGRIDVREGRNAITARQAPLL
jgi:hypothetical protein